jgi:hypothetical protein
MRSAHLNVSLPLMALLAAAVSISCGGSASMPSDKPQGTQNMKSSPNISLAGAVKLRAPVLSFNDTGLSVSDGVTRNGLWDVDSAGIDWEFSLDLGLTWVRGEGASFEVKGDGASMIWVRARDDAGNTSEIVQVNCVLDTMAPAALTISAQAEGTTNRLQLFGLEPDAQWEYSLNGQSPWHPGRGTALGVLGNGLNRVWLRQVDLAGNTSEVQAFDLQSPGLLAYEASDDPLRPSILAAGLQTYLIHGVVIRGDRDYVRWDVPNGLSVLSVRLVLYASDDLVAFYALQRNSVFDAGIDTTRMLSFGHMGPNDLNRNVLADTPPQLRSEGPMTLWFQQTGSLPTQYAIEVTLASLN